VHAPNHSLTRTPPMHVRNHLPTRTTPRTDITQSRPKTVLVWHENARLTTDPDYFSAKKKSSFKGKSTSTSSKPAGTSSSKPSLPLPAARTSKPSHLSSRYLVRRSEVLPLCRHRCHLSRSPHPALRYVAIAETVFALGTSASIEVPSSKMRKNSS
jgi:hypothetical protein